MILVTGGGGYIGSHCVLTLLKSGFDVVIFDNLELGHIETVDTLQNLKTKGKIVDFIKGDLKNPNDIKSVFEKHKIKAVIHFAAYSQVAESVKDPQKYHQNNVIGSKNLIEAMTSAKVDKIVFSSTAAVYGAPDTMPIDEDTPTNPINPYGKTKLEVENLLDEYGQTHGLKSVRLRYFNVAGADSDAIIGEWHIPETHLIPNILKSVFGAEQIFEMYGDDYPTKDGTCVRDYVNVEDLAQAHRLALEYLFDGGETDIFNLGTNEGNSVKEVFDMCEKITGRKIPLEIKPRRDGDPTVLVADNQKARKILNWKPCKTLEDSIQSAYLWEIKLQAQLAKVSMQ